MAPSQTYNIGQIIYILSNKSQSVVPAIVAEEDIRRVRNSEGIQEVLNYKLLVGPKDRQRKIDLSQIDGEVFSSLDQIREHLVGRLTLFVAELVKTTQQSVLNWYGVTSDNQVLESSEPSGTRFDPEQIINAVTNNTPLPTTQGGQHPLQLQGGMQTPGPYNSLRENLRAMATPEDESFDSGSQQQQYAIMPDGTRVPVRT